jgi:VWFA-related protein
MPEMFRAEDTIARENGNAMAQLAQATGGVYFHDNNDLLSGLQRFFDDQRQRYLIVYSPSNDTEDGKFRKIKVTVANKKLQVFAKSGYWAPAN